jgi:hypothetical protein
MKPRKKKPARRVDVKILQGPNPRQCKPHPEPTPKGDPAHCLDCERDICGIHHPVLRKATPKELKELEEKYLKETLGDEAFQRLRDGLESFAERMFGRKEKAKRKKPKG